MLSLLSRAQIRLVTTLLILIVQSCVTSPLLPPRRATRSSSLRGSVLERRELRVGGLLCRLRGGSSLPVRQGSTIEKEKQAGSEVESARCRPCPRHLLWASLSLSRFCQREPVSRLGFVRMSSSETSRCTAAAVCATRKKNEGPVIFTNVSSTAPLAPRQPPLTITYTNDGATVANWLQRHVGADVCCVGFDTETAPSFRRTSAPWSSAPATLQLATSEGACLVVHLAHVPRKNCFVSPASQGRIKDAPDGKGLLRLRGMDELADVLNSTRVMKVEWA